MEQKKDYLLILWGLNLLLFIVYITNNFGVNYLKSSVLEYSNIKSDKFDGTVYPISYIPNWLTLKNRNTAFSDIPIENFVSIPKYDLSNLEDSSGKNKNNLIARSTYTVVYIGSYRMNYLEYDGSHPAIDIIAPAGTPVVSVANGVVIKVKNDSGGNGKMVIIRHDNAKFNGNTETLYSSYLHLSEINIVEGVKVKKGELIGKVGKTGIATTNHLHFQIDRANAAYHPFWPFTTKQANDNGLGFFEAINAGLGKEDALKYTVHPMEFVQNNLSDSNVNLDFFGKKEEEIKNDDKKTSEQIDKLVSELTGNNTSTGKTETKEEKNTDKIEKTLNGVDDLLQDLEKITPIKTITKEDVVISDKEENKKEPEKNKETNLAGNPINNTFFSDVKENSTFYKSAKYVLDKGLMKGYSDNSFKPENGITRKEALLVVFRNFEINTNYSNGVNNFTDIDKNDDFQKYLNKGVELKIVNNASLFRPNDRVTRAEFMAMFIRTYKILRNETTEYSGENRFFDLKKEDNFYNPINNFGELFKIRNSYLNGNEVIKRGEVSKILYSYSNIK